MADVKWIKIVTDIFDDEKMLLIDGIPDRDAIIVIWFKLLCLAGKQNNGGVFMLNDRIAYTDEMLATIFRRNLNTVRLALSTFEKFGMIEIINDTITIPNWGKHQNLDGLQARKAYMREYMKGYRERQAEIAMQEHEEEQRGKSCKHLRKPNVSSPDIDKDKDKEEDILYAQEKSSADALEQEKSSETKTKKVFSPPSVEEVAAYCAERKNSIDANAFVDYYQARNWMLGKTKMKDWKAAVRTWERNQYGSGRKKAATSNTPEGTYMKDGKMYDRFGNELI